MEPVKVFYLFSVPESDLDRCFLIPDNSEAIPEKEW